MSAFGNYAPHQVTEAAEKCITKMDEAELALAIESSERTMSAEQRSLLVEAVFEAFRQRGESSEDAAEGAGTSLHAITMGETRAVQQLLAYAQQNPGLLKDATIALIERNLGVLDDLPASITGAISQRLLAQ